MIRYNLPTLSYDQLNLVLRTINASDVASEVGMDSGMIGGGRGVENLDVSSTRI